MTCPACDLENVPTADVCDCGYAFTDTGRAAVRNAASGSSRRPCPYCKEMIQSNAVLCPHCREHVSPVGIQINFARHVVGLAAACGGLYLVYLLYQLMNK